MKLTHKNHPSAVWTRTSLSNYNWLLELTKELCKEYTFRYEKIHKCETEYLQTLEDNKPDIKDIGLTLPNQAMPDTYKIETNNIEDVVEAYRQYYFYENKTKSIVGIDNVPIPIAIQTLYVDKDNIFAMDSSPISTGFFRTYNENENPDLKKLSGRVDSYALSPSPTFYNMLSQENKTCLNNLYQPFNPCTFFPYYNDCGSYDKCEQYCRSENDYIEDLMTNISNVQ